MTEPMTSELLSVRETEARDAHRRFIAIAFVLREGLVQTALVKDKPWSQDDEAQVREVLIKLAPYAHSKISQDLYWPHLILPGIYAERLTAVVDDPDLGPLEARALLPLHDVGRLVLAHRYRMNDLIGGNLLRRAGVREECLGKYSPFEDILGFGEHRVDNVGDMTVAQRIMDLCDNIGKLAPNGILFDVQGMIAHDLKQPERYPEGPWSPENRGREALVQGGRQVIGTDLIAQEVRWLEAETGVDFSSMREEVIGEFNLPENQAFLLRLRDARETLDPKVDEKLKRPAVSTVIFDIGGVLMQDADSTLIKNLTASFDSTEKEVLAILKEINDLSMSGQISEEEYLTRFWQHFGKVCPPNIEDARGPFIQPEIYKPVEGMPEIVKSLLEKGINVYLLSNIITPLTGPMSNFLRKKYHFLDFDKVFYSCDIKASKKGANTPGLVLQRIGNPNPESVLFVDDVPAYVDSFRRNNTRAFTFQDNPYTKVTAAQRLREELELAGLI